VGIVLNALDAPPTSLLPARRAPARNANSHCGPRLIVASTSVRAARAAPGPGQRFRLYTDTDEVIRSAC
jgi:hypothetical protein